MGKEQAFTLFASGVKQHNFTILGSNAFLLDPVESLKDKWITPAHTDPTRFYLEGFTEPEFNKSKKVNRKLTFPSADLSLCPRVFLNYAL